MHTARDAAGVARMVANDLEDAAIASRPELADVIAELRGRGALAAAVSGSGPTVSPSRPTAGPASGSRAEIPEAILTVPL